MWDSVRSHVVPIARIVLLAVLAVMSTAAAASKTCPRPKDQQGRPLYEILTGTVQSSGRPPGGGHFLTLVPMNLKTGQVIGGPVSVSVPDEIYATAQSLAPGTHITLLGYIGHAMSGARPGYTCMEIVPVPN